MKNRPGEVKLTLNAAPSVVQELTFPANFLQTNPFIQELIDKFNATTSEGSKLEVICSFQKLMNLVRYNENYIYDQDDPALLPEWKWLYGVIEKIEATRKTLFNAIFDDDWTE